MIGDSRYPAAMHHLRPTHSVVIPAKAGTQLMSCAGVEVDPCFLRDAVVMDRKGNMK